jgi:uncharacterized membrane protein YraQ (UPF0718 family)/copper chaperone CopZ
MEWIRLYLGEVVRLVNEMSPYLLMGFLFAGLFRVVFPRRVITRYMGGRNLMSVVNASLLGIPLPLCSCGVLPTGIGFYRNGASRGSTISFLISTPQTGVDSILATYSLLGLPLAIIRPLVALATGVFGGLLGNLSDRNGPVERAGQMEPEEKHERTLRELFRYGFVELLQDISRWLILGMLAAALLSVLIPADFFTQTVSNEYLALLIMLLVSVPLYICATGSIPIAAVLLMKGLAPGAALVLLMAGPATNIATIAVIGNVLGKRTLRIYLTSIIGGALLFGIMINELVPREWITGGIRSLSEGAMHEHTTGAFRWISSAMLMLLIVNGYRLKISKRRVNNRENMKDSENRVEWKVAFNNRHSFRVEGMTCNHCKASVEKGISKLDQVKGVWADPGRNQVVIEAGTLSDAEVRATVEGLGYVFRGRIEGG